MVRESGGGPARGLLPGLVGMLLLSVGGGMGTGAGGRGGGAAPGTAGLVTGAWILGLENE